MDQATSCDHAVGGQVLSHRIGQLAILHEGALVEEQVDSIAYEELVRACQLAGRPFRRRAVRSRAALIWSMIDYSTGSPSRRAIKIRCTSEVPSPISRTFASR